MHLDTGFYDIFIFDICCLAYGKLFIDYDKNGVFGNFNSPVTMKAKAAGFLTMARGRKSYNRLENVFSDITL